MALKNVFFNERPGMMLFEDTLIYNYVNGFYISFLNSVF